MKRLTALFIALILLCSFSACNSSSGSAGNQDSPEAVLQTMYSSLGSMCTADADSADFDRSFEQYYNSSYYLVFNNSIKKDSFKSEMQARVREFTYDTADFTVNITENRAATQAEKDEALASLKENNAAVTDVTDAYVLTYSLKLKYGNKDDGYSEETDDGLKAIILKKDGKWYCDYDYIALVSVSVSYNN